MLDPVLGVQTANIQWFSNGVWKEMPHRHFFVNNLRQHFSNNNKRMADATKKMWSNLYKSYLLKDQNIQINHIKFRVVKETVITEVVHEAPAV